MKSNDCIVCGGSGEVSAEVIVSNGSHPEYGPDYIEVLRQTTCTDCDGDGLVDEDIHAEQNGGRHGTPEEWAIDMVVRSCRD